MFCFGVLSPHAPILLPEVGGEERAKVQSTIRALNQAAEEMAASKPEKIIIISPHAEYGFSVPLYFLSQKLPKRPEIEKILVSNPSYHYYSKLGQEYTKKIQNTKQRVAIIASGDLSHVLKDDGPYGFHPDGPKLDKIICQSIKNKDLQTLLDLDPLILENGAECGLRSLIFLLAAFASVDYKSSLLSYEGPFGVGYAVATFKPKEPK